MPWSVFLRAHWRALAAADFFTMEVWSWRGLMTHYVLFVIELATRRAHRRDHCSTRCGLDDADGS
jgi:hypothetical protein